MSAPEPFFPDAEVAPLEDTRKRDKMRHSVYDIGVVLWSRCVFKNVVPVAGYFMLVLGLYWLCGYMDFDLWAWMVEKK